MKYRKLGTSGLQVSVIGIGTWQFGGEWGKAFTEQEAAAILDSAQAHGINLIDTAECYGDHLSERLVGASIAGQRDKWIVATKFGHHFHRHMDRTQHWRPEEVQSQLEGSLKALRTDYIDLYQFHSGTDEVFDNDALWTMLDKQVQAGKIRHLGISIGSNANLHQTEAATRVGARAIQVVYNRLDRKPEERVFPACERQELGVLARVPLASGYLSGKYQPGASFAADDVRAAHNEADVRRKLEEVQRIQRDEVPAGTEMAKWALAWCLQHPAVTCVIPGCKSVQQVEDNAAAAELELVRPDHPQAVAR
ncbi:aldo/keto reductase [Paenibacillus sp. IB182496]|uniref:Aldo/keto reductase n=1 Tax=Paenibacillus sabuli TaxID=2772509 RepID=A0A927BWZ5_9BACL|nr:aldo/keto reductase [Paenibacillus sabuli]MBD2846878.1 aldo/keto reductase [Paenibacillus sabuli]